MHSGFQSHPIYNNKLKITFMINNKIIILAILIFYVNI